MSNAIAARTFGDDYQGMVFWKYANEMLDKNSNVLLVRYEDSEIKSFDDIVITYKRKVKFRDDAILKDYIQVKFHMRQTDFFTIDNLLNPSFINAKEKSLMDNIVSAYRQLGEEFKDNRFIIYSMWDIKQNDPLYEIVNNTECTFDIGKIFDGTTSRSKMGKIRKKFYDKLNVTEGELKKILMQTCIYSGRENLVEIEESINQQLKYNGLKAWPKSKITNPYVDMIHNWMKTGKKEFNKEFLLDECSNEQLLADKQSASIIAIRSFIPFAGNIEAEVESHLDLVDFFDGRFLKDNASWEEINDKIINYSREKLNKDTEYKIMLPTHFSIAFLGGRALNTKSGIKTIVVQNTLDGKSLWGIKQGCDDAYDVLQVKQSVLDESIHDSAIVVGITNDIEQDVREYIEEEKIMVGKMYYCMIDKPGNNAILDGKHAWQITEQLNNILGQRSLKEKRGKIHIFYAGPASIMFNLGKLSLSYGQIQFYEYDFQRRRTGTYYPTCKLPMKGEI